MSDATSKHQKGVDWKPWLVDTVPPSISQTKHVLWQPLTWAVRIIFMAAIGVVGVGFFNWLYLRAYASLPQYPSYYARPLQFSDIFLILVLWGGAILFSVSFIPRFLWQFLLFTMSIGYEAQYVFVERVITVVGYKWTESWRRLAIRIAFLLFFGLGALLSILVGASYIAATDLADIQLTWLQFVGSFWAGAMPYAAPCIYAFVPLVAAGFASSLGLSAVFQAAELYSLRKRMLRARTLTRKSIVGGGVELTVAHLSDLHLTDSDNTSLLEEGHGSPNRKYKQAVNSLLPSIDSIDVVLITGDITDSGAPHEWAAFFSSMPPEIMEKTIILPGNHDINITDKQRPWRVELVSSIARRTRLVRIICAMDIVQGTRCKILDKKGNLVDLSTYIKKRRDALTYSIGENIGAADRVPDDVWSKIFPMAICLERPRAVMFLLDSNEQATNIVDNAFGRISSEQLGRLKVMVDQFTPYSSLFALHHHVALPMDLTSPVLKGRIFERFTVLQNADALLDALPSETETVIFHGHRHVDFRGSLGLAQIIAARSTTIGDVVSNDGPGYYIHQFGRANSGGLALSDSRFVSLAGVEDVRGDAVGSSIG
jgi:Calcineurin-like phosphoesterase